MHQHQRVHRSDAEHEVLVALGEHLGRLANRDLAARCALGAGSKHLGRAERKRALTAQCSSRWAGSITRRTDDVWERQMLNYRDELIDKQAAVAAIVERLAKPVGESGGYARRSRSVSPNRSGCRRCGGGSGGSRGASRWDVCRWCAAASGC